MRGFRRAKESTAETPGCSLGVRHNFLLQTLLDMKRKYPPQPRKSLSPDERMARNVIRQAEAEQAMREHAADQAAFHKNRERLRAERIAREADSDLVVAATVPQRTQA